MNVIDYKYVTKKSNTTTEEEEDMLPGVGAPDDDGHHVERAGGGPPEDPHVGAEVDLPEMFLPELSIRQTNKLLSFS